MREPLRSFMPALLALLAVAGLAACSSDGSAGARVAPDGHAAAELQALGSLDEAVAVAQDDQRDATVPAVEHQPVMGTVPSQQQ